MAGGANGTRPDARSAIGADDEAARGLGSNQPTLLGSGGSTAALGPAIARVIGGSMASHVPPPAADPEADFPDVHSTQDSLPFGDHSTYLMTAGNRHSWPITSSSEFANDPAGEGYLVWRGSRRYRNRVFLVRVPLGGHRSALVAPDFASHLVRLALEDGERPGVPLTEPVTLPSVAYVLMLSEFDPPARGHIDFDDIDSILSDSSVQFFTGKDPTRYVLKFGEMDRQSGQITWFEKFAPNSAAVAPDEHAGTFAVVPEPLSQLPVVILIGVWFTRRPSERRLRC
jgi:hypothetical protein